MFKGQRASLDFVFLEPKYRSNHNIEVSEILKYGYNNEKRIAEIRDKKGNLYFVEIHHVILKEKRIRFSVLSIEKNNSTEKCKGIKNNNSVKENGN